MDHRLLLAAVAAAPLPLAGLAVWWIEPPWQPFAGQAVTSLGTVLTLLPATVIAARMLSALGAGGDGHLKLLDRWLQSLAGAPRGWHYELLIVGLVLVVAGSLVSTWASWPP